MKKTILACFAIVLALFMVACDDTPQSTTSEGYSKPDWVRTGSYTGTSSVIMGSVSLPISMELTINDSDFEFSMAIGESPSLSPLPLTVESSTIYPSTNRWELVVSMGSDPNKTTLNLTITPTDNGLIVNISTDNQALPLPSGDVELTYVPTEV